MTPDSFDDLVRPFRRELAAYCYRMLGSHADAEDQVQETLLRAWRGIDGFEGRASVRSWLYRIATNVCIDALRARPRRAIPAETGVVIASDGPLPPTDPELVWLEPSPLIEEVASPEARVSSRESVQLAFITALQHLPATQRAAVILRDVLGWSAAEVAELLATTVPAVNSALQRARETLEQRRRPAGPALDDDARRLLLERYMRAWEDRDLDALAALLHEDVVSSMPPIPGYIVGRAALVEFIESHVGAPGGRRLLRVEAADETAIAFYARDDEGVYRAHAIQILALDGALVREIHAFLQDDLFARFGLPLIHR